jgi:F-type H+-transporting ATPase subunit a
VIASVLALSTNPLTHIVPHDYIPGKLDNHMVMMVLAAILLLLFVPVAVRRRKGSDEIQRHVPSGVGNFLEAVCSFLRREVARPTIGRHADVFVPYLWTAFFFILLCNLLGLVPLGALTGGRLHIGGTATGNIAVTGGLAVCTLAMVVFNGLRLSGFAYVAHFCPGPLLLAPLLVPVEIIGLVAKIFALAMRLFANMIAGHILLAVLLSFVTVSWAALGALGSMAIAIPVVLGSVAINLLEIFVAFLQAFIFTILSAVFIGQAVQAGEHHAGGEHEHAAAAAH